MKHVRIVTSLVLALSAAPATLATAHEFNATAMGKLTLKAAGIARFRNVAGLVECKQQKLALGDAPLASKTLQLTIEYSGCSAFGLAATLSPGRYELNAEGSASLLNTVTAKALSCLVTFPSTKNKNLSTVKYVQTGKEVELVQGLTKITASGVGAACLFAEESNGLFTDVSLISLANGMGSVEWK
jgi:hypothetical protein